MELEHMDDRRFCTRYIIRVPFHMRGLNSRGENVDTQIEVVDISLEGMGFVSDKGFDDGEILYVTLRGKDYSSDVNIQILWRDEGQHRYGARILSVTGRT